MSENCISILLVDDHPVLRSGLRALLESEEDMQVIEESGTGADAIQKAFAVEPDVIVLDLGLPDMSGLEVIRTIRQQNSKSRIIVLSMHSRREFVFSAIEAGCDGYVPKSSTHKSLIQAIRVVLTGERYLDPTPATVLMEKYTEKESEQEQFASLSQREQEVVQLAAMGFTSREIGEKKFISSKTVDTYRQRAMEKLGLKHRSELIRFAVRAGILNDYKK